jgi:hypothetical protein
LSPGHDQGKMIIFHLYKLAHPVLENNRAYPFNKAGLHNKILRVKYDRLNKELLGRSHDTKN